MRTIQIVFAVGLFVVTVLTTQVSVAQQPLQATTGSAKQDQAAEDPSARAEAKHDATKSNAADNPFSKSTVASSLEEKLKQLAASGRIQQIGESSSTRLQPAVHLAPGAPPILAFRYFDGQARHRFGDLDLVMDDAGH